MGHGSARIARALGVRETTIRQIVRGDARTVSPHAPRRHRRPLRRLVGQARPRPHPLRARRRHRRPQARHRRELVRRRRPGRRPARHPRLPAPPRLETRHRHRRRPRHPARPPPPPEGRRMTSDHRVTCGLILDILDALERHGYHRSDDLHAGRAIGLIGDLACIYEGTQETTPARHSPRRIPSQHRPARTQARAPSPSPPPRPAPSSPRRTSPPTTSATASRCAPTAPTSPAPPARPTSATPRPSTRWPTACSRPPEPPRPLTAASTGPPRRSGPAADQEAGQ